MTTANDHLQAIREATKAIIGIGATVNPTGIVDAGLAIYRHLIALEAMLGEREWRPIESAPRDGSDFLAKAQKVEFYQVIYWDDASKDPLRHWAVADTSLHYHDDMFECWMELPIAPAAPKTEEG